MADAAYDYVIVGAGSAGCCLAHRLSEARDCRILVLEAGGWDRDPRIRVPLAWPEILKKRLYDWHYECEPEDTLDGRAIEFARGKVVGGCSSTNAMAHVRGDPSDFDRWAANGLPTWSFEACLPYFKRQESWEGGANAYRGGDGPLAVRTCRYADPILGGYVEAALDCGHTWTDDYNAAQHSGFGWLQMTIRNGRRCSAATAYLRPALRRGNVDVVTGALATRVVFEGRRAVGVAYRTRDGERIARAECEVILAGGVANTPKLLMHSGIGDSDHLSAHDIETRTALPGVGANLQDHPSVMLMYRRVGPSPFLRAMRADRIAPAMAAAYLFGTGFATDVPGGVTGFLHSDSRQRDVPDLQVLLTAASLASWPWFPGLRKPFPDMYVARLVLTRPQSRGAIRLRSADPAAPPRVHQRMLTREADWQALRRGVRMLDEIAHQPAMRPFTAGRHLPATTGALNDGTVDAHIRATATTVHHPLGTCRMGTDSDAGAVVDEQLRVRGHDGLRIVDASVMPDAISGNINAAVIMIAERAAEMIHGHASATDG